ncbi:MAG: hypothetical protein HFE36_01855 [Clostridia bacterium]|nr:hypothetical protein [Clostridia bacterium]
MRKKIVLIVTALILALSACSLVACKNEGDGSAKVIVVSAAEYKTADEAVRGYVENELALYCAEEPMLTAEFVSKESKGDADLEKLGLNEIDKKDLAKAELFGVTAKIEFADAETGYDAETVTAAMEMYVFEYGEGKFAYAVPEAKIGERVTNSEINKAFNYDTHSNCTETSIREGFSKDGSPWKFDSASVAQHTATERMYVHYYDKTRFETGVPNYTLEEISDDYYYDVTEGTETYSTSSYNDSAYKMEFTVAESFKEYIELNITNVVGYFGREKGLVKTATGAKTAVTFYEGVKCEGECVITITDGKLTQIMYCLTAEETKGGQTEKVGLKETTKFDKFGSTVITGATDAKQKVAAYKAQHAE